jgi:hypothetical protein
MNLVGGSLAETDLLNEERAEVQQFFKSYVKEGVVAADTDIIAI